MFRLPGSLALNDKGAVSDVNSDIGLHAACQAATINRTGRSYRRRLFSAPAIAASDPSCNPGRVDCLRLAQMGDVQFARFLCN
jgi:hypothetical protein